MTTIWPDALFHRDEGGGETMTNIHGVLYGPTNSRVNPTLPEMTARRRTLSMHPEVTREG